MIKRFYNKGFTLIEMMVAVSIFVMVAFIVTTAFIHVADAYRTSQKTRAIIENLNFSMDLMAFKLREGNNILCGQTDGDCGLGLPSFYFREIAFTDTLGQPVQYRFVPAGETVDRGHIESCVNGACSILTSEDIEITDISGFYISKGKDVDGLDRQTKVIILINGTVDGKTPTNFSMQTTISKRN